jgi:hypothetical protein
MPTPRATGAVSRRLRLGFGGSQRIAAFHRKSVDVTEAVDAWQAQYRGLPPVGFMLRFPFEEQWTRVHYLSDEGVAAADERNIQNFDAIASALFNGATVLVLAIHLNPGHEATDEMRDIGATTIEAPSSWIESLTDYLPDLSQAEFVAATLTWYRGCLDGVWRAVSRERIGRVAVFSPATGDAICPYSGGADVFVWGSNRRAKLGDRFRAWVPAPGTPGSAPPSLPSAAVAGA